MKSSIQLRNRSSLFFITGLLIAGGLASGIDAAWKNPFFGQTNAIDLTQIIDVKIRSPAALSSADIAAAMTAWRFFESNTDSKTGLVGSVEGFGSATLWDMGSHMMALVSANRLGLLSKSDFDLRVTHFLTSLSQLPLYDGRLPNKAYNIQTLQMTDYQNIPVSDGIGWSAIDIARVLLALRILEQSDPTKGAAIQAAVHLWDICAITKAGEMSGAERIDGETVLFQEGRLGYEQYAARSAALWGCDSVAAASAERVVAWQTVSGVQVPGDIRAHTEFGSITPTLGEPYMLMGLELGFNRESEILASRIYAANEARYFLDGIPTAVTEDHLDRAPYFVYASVFGNEQPWAVTDDKGNAYPEMRTISLKAVMAWDALYATAYTADLRALVADLAVKDRGWFAGKFEIDLTVNTAISLNTNAVVLEAMHFKLFGPMLLYKQPALSALIAKGQRANGERPVKAVTRSSW